MRAGRPAALHAHGAAPVPSSAAPPALCRALCRRHPAQNRRGRIAIAAWRRRDAPAVGRFAGHGAPSRTGERQSRSASSMALPLLPSGGHDCEWGTLAATLCGRTVVGVYPGRNAVGVYPGDTARNIQCAASKRRAAGGEAAGDAWTRCHWADHRDMRRRCWSVVVA